MKFHCVEHYDLFEDETIFWVEIQEPPQIIQDAASRIDNQKCNPNSFGICIYLGAETNEFDIITDSDPTTGESRNLYYIDVDGDKHWFQADLSGTLRQEIFAGCSRALTGIDGIGGYAIKEKFMLSEKEGIVLGESSDSHLPFKTWGFTIDEYGRYRDTWCCYHQDSTQARQNILDGLEIYAQEMRGSGDPEHWVAECEALSEQLQVERQTETQINMEMGGM